MNEAIVSHDGPGHRWLASLGRRGMELGLDRVRTVLARLGDPQRDLPVIAVAGTDGKGSTSAMIAALLRAAGLRTAHYTSPHLVETRERIALPDGTASAEALDDALARVQAACAPDLDPTPFEALTAAALLLIVEAQSEVAVLEVGLGGRLDAVNATEPVVSVICNLAYDHMAILGDTLPQIAWEKAGIARDHRALVCAQPGLVKPALRKYAIEPQILSLGKDVAVVSAAWAGNARRSTGILRGPLLEDDLTIELSLPGRHQLDNAALAVMAYLSFAEWWLPMTGHRLPPVDEVVVALGEVNWPLRAEVIQNDPLVLVDAAHNPSGMAALAALLAERGPGWQIMLAVRKDRDAAELIRALAPLTACFWLPRCQGETLRDPAEVAAIVDQVAPSALVAVGPAKRCYEQALREVGRGPGLAITGSQHALGEWLQTGVLHSPRLAQRLAKG